MTSIVALPCVVLSAIFSVSIVVRLVVFPVCPVDFVVCIGKYVVSVVGNNSVVVAEIKQNKYQLTFYSVCLLCLLHDV